MSEKTAQEVAHAAAARLQEGIEREYPQLDVFVEPWDYYDKIRFRVTDPETGKSLKSDTVPLHGATDEVRSDLVLGGIQDWLAGRSG